MLNLFPEIPWNSEIQSAYSLCWIFLLHKSFFKVLFRLQDILSLWKMSDMFFDWLVILWNTAKWNTAKWNLTIIHFVIYTCTFPSVHLSNVFCGNLKLFPKRDGAPRSDVVKPFISVKLGLTHSKPWLLLAVDPSAGVSMKNAASC